jgi:histidinol-phosphate aminotransferase
VGALIAHRETLDEIRPRLEPFAVNICAVKALSAALDDRAYIESYVAQAAASRQLVYDFCWRHGLRSWPSDGNFVLFRVGADAPAVVAALAKHGILVKDKSDTPGCAGCIRMTAGAVEDTNVALEALEAILASRAR